MWIVRRLSRLVFHTTFTPELPTVCGQARTSLHGRGFFTLLVSVAADTSSIMIGRGHRIHECAGFECCRPAAAVIRLLLFLGHVLQLIRVCLRFPSRSAVPLPMSLYANRPCTAASVIFFSSLHSNLRLCTKISKSPPVPSSMRNSGVDQFSWCYLRLVRHCSLLARFASVSACDAACFNSAPLLTGLC